MNKKGVAQIAITVGVSIAVIGLIFVLFSSGVLGDKFGVEGKSPSTCPVKEQESFRMQLNGNVLVRDGGIIAIEPEVVDVRDLSLKKLAVKTEPFDYKVTLFEDNAEIDAFESSGELVSKPSFLPAISPLLPPGGVEDVKVPFSVFFDPKDRNCNGVFDEVVSFKLKAEVTEKTDFFDNKETETSRTVTISGGKIQ